MNLSEVSQRLTDLITKELEYGEEQKEIIAYGIETVFLSIAGFVTILLAAYIFNALVPAAIAAVFGGLLRKVSGGAHFNTPLKCLAFGVFIYSLIGVLAKKLLGYNLIDNEVLLFLLFVCLVLVAFLAPVDCEAKPIRSRSFRIKLKTASIIFVLMSFVIISFSRNNLLNISAVLGIVYQTMTLLPVFNKKRRCDEG